MTPVRVTPSLVAVALTSLACASICNTRSMNTQVEATITLYRFQILLAIFGALRSFVSWPYRSADKGYQRQPGEDTKSFYNSCHWIYLAPKAVITNITTYLKCSNNICYLLYYEHLLSELKHVPRLALRGDWLQNKHCTYACAYSVNDWRDWSDRGHLRRTSALGGGKGGSLKQTILRWMWVN